MVLIASVKGSGRNSGYDGIHDFLFCYAAVRKLRVDSNTAWRLALKRAGIQNFRFHDLRHTWASWLVQTGVPLSALQEMVRPTGLDINNQSIDYK